MAKKKQSRTQEGLLIVFVAACVVLVAATVIIAFDEAGVGAADQGYFDDGIGPYSPQAPTLIVPTARPGSGSGGGSGSGSGGGGGSDHDEHDEHDASAVETEPSAIPDAIDADRQATLQARMDAEQQGLAY